VAARNGVVAKPDWDQGFWFTDELPEVQQWLKERKYV